MYQRRIGYWILLEVVEGGGWKGSYSELEEVVGRLEEEGEKRWREEKRKEKGKREGRNGGREWKEMGRLAREVLWEIEERKRREEGRGEEEEEDGEMITLHGMRKNLADEKKGREEERKRADEEKRKREESEQKAVEEKNRADEEKRKREELERRADEEKREMEERIRNLEQKMNERKYTTITSLDGLSISFPQSDGIKREGNTIIHHGSTSERNCFIGEEMTSV